MLVKDAKALARQWVREAASTQAGFLGAYFAGSSTWLADDAVMPATSDLDVNVVWSDSKTPMPQRGKFVYDGVLLEVTLLTLDQLSSPELVLSHYHLAGGLRTPGLILDPTGKLAQLQAAVARDYSQRKWVRRRCEHARSRVLEQLAALQENDPFPNQVVGWLFPTGVTTHMLLVAGLRNPTVRNRYVAARALLAEYGYLALHETLLELLGCATMSRTRVEQHLAALTTVFDAAKAVVKTPFSFASDISDAARPIAIAGSQELIEHGLQREAVFWIAVTASRCQQVLAADAPAELKDAFDTDYRLLLGDLGIESFADIRERAELVKAQLLHVWDVAEAIMAANPGIV